MKLTCLSKGEGFYFPPCHMLNICGFRVLLDCPIDLSALTIFSPIPIDYDGEVSNYSAQNLNSADGKSNRVEKPLEASDLIRAVPWYKTVKSLHLWDVSFIDIVLISSPMGMLGLPFFTQLKKFSAKIYATEATVRLGKLMMEDLVSMHAEFRQFYGPEENGFPQWLKWEELEMLPSALRVIAMGEDGAELGSWKPLYSAAHVKECIQKTQSLKYAEEVYHNGTLVIKAFSSGLEIGASNWVINGPKRNFTWLSSSIFASRHAMGFDYNSLQGNGVILFSDFSSMCGNVSVGINAYRSMNQIRPKVNSPTGSDFSTLRDGNNSKEDFIKSVTDTGENTVEIDKLAFICSCAIDSVREGGSVLIPIGRLGIILQLLEQISISLESSNLNVPMFIISDVAEEILSLMNVVPEWLCEQRQQKC